MTLDLQSIFENFLNQVGSLLPGVLGALLVLFVGWLIASSLGRVAGNLIKRTGIQNRLASARSSKVDLISMTRKLVYYILMAVVLLVVLEMLGVRNVLQPVEDMLSQFFSAIPRIVVAGIIAFAGYVLGTIVSDLVGLASGTIEGWLDKAGIPYAEFDATKLLKQLVFLVIFVPLLITAFDYLEMKVISDPAKMMLGEFMAAIPNILAAAIIIGVFYIIGKYVTKMLSSLLRNLNADALPHQIGLGAVMGSRSFSGMVGNLVFFFLLFFGVITAVEKLEFASLSEVLRNILDLSGSILLGLVILVLGNFIASLAHKAMSASDKFLADIARVAILGLFLAISLRSMGIADDIINMAFGLVLGSVAVAVALAYGLGGREAAGKHMEEILGRFRKNS